MADRPHGVCTDTAVQLSLKHVADKKPFYIRSLIDRLIVNQQCHSLSPNECHHSRPRGSSTCSTSGLDNRETPSGVSAKEFKESAVRTGRERVSVVVRVVGVDGSTSPVSPMY
eukprot:Selendium_serpulae@DN6150_c0_g1_i6.p1